MPVLCRRPVVTFIHVRFARVQLVDLVSRPLMPDPFQSTVSFLTALVKDASTVLLRPRRSLARG
jgi:hypothetical protein